MSKIQNPSGKTSVEEFALDELSGEARRSIRARAKERRKQRLFNQDPKPDAKSAPQSGGDSGIAEFKFLECDPITIDGRPAPECPFCTEDPMAYVPDYTTMFPGEVFYDGRECTYCITMEVAPSHLGGPTVAQLNNNEKIKNEIKRTGINKLLEAYNKSKVATVYYYLENETQEQSLAATIGLAALAISTGGASLVVEALIPDQVTGYTLVAEQRDVVEELLPYTTLNYTVPVPLNARTKIKICIDSEVFFRAPANAIAEPETPFETKYEVTLAGKNFSRFGDIWKVIRSMKSYNKQFTRWQLLDGGRLSKVTDNGLYALDLEKEAEMLEEFQSHVTSMMYDSGFKNMKNIENITFKFEPIDSGENPRIRLKQIIMNKFGCPEVVFDKETGLTRAKFEGLVRNDEFGRTSTLYYVGSLPEMHYDVSAREPLPWLEFLLKYTYPNLQVYYGSESDTLFNDPSLGSCLAESILTGDGAVEDFIDGSLEDLLALPDAFLEEFSKNLCLTPEELDKQNDTLREKYDRAIDRVLSEEKRKITGGNKYFEFVLLEIEKKIGLASADEKINLTTDKVMDRLGYCGWIALMMAALDCVYQGLGEKDFKTAMAEGALGAMSDAALQWLCSGLPPEEQAKLVAEIDDEWKDLPAPWDTQAYQIGNYPGGEFTEEMLYTEAQKMENEEYAEAKEKYEGLVSNLEIDLEQMGSEDTDLGTQFNIAFSVEESRQQIEEAKTNLEKVNAEQFPGTVVSGIKDTSTGILGVGFDGEDFSFGEVSKGAGGTYGTAAGNTQKLLFDAYRNQMLKSLDVDLLLNELGRLPGAPIVASFLSSLPCKPTPPWAFDPRLDSFMNTLEFDFCQVADGKMFDLTKPKFSGFNVGWNNPYQAIRKAIEEAVKNLLVSLAMRAIKSLIEFSLNAACDAAALLGAGLVDLIDGSDDLRDLLANNLCPDQDPESVGEALKDLFATLGGMDASCLMELTGEEMGQFIDDLSIMLTQDQICALLKGTADSSILSLAAEVARASSSECIREVFSSQDMIASLFSALGRLLPVDEICADSAGDVPATACPPDTIAEIEKLRCNMLADKGLSSEECRSELDKLKDAAIAAAKDLGDLMQNGPYGDMPPLIGDGCTEGIMSGNNPLMDEVVGAVSGMVLSPIETGVITDMFGRVEIFFGGGGFFNAVLSDTKGRAWKGHNFMVKYFGAPRADQQGLLEFYSDDAIRSLDGWEDSGFKFAIPLEFEPRPVNVYNQKVDPANVLDVSSGGFPPTVAAWLAKQYRELDPAFKTVTIPAGYSSIQEANDDVAAKTAARSENIESRKKYVEAFIVANNLDENNSHKEEIQFANILRETVQRSVGKLFIPGLLNKDEEPSGLSAEEKMTRHVLLGYGAEEFGTNKIRCCSDVNSFDATDAVEIKDGEGTHPSEWPHGAQVAAGTDGKAWADWALSEFGDTVPVEVPVATTSDLYIPYVGHATEEEPLRLTVGYDYNMFEEGESIKKGGDYRIKITKETPADATLGEPGYLLDTHNLLVESGILPEVQTVLDSLPLSEVVMTRGKWKLSTA
jgi:hypothetical protein